MEKLQKISRIALNILNIFKIFVILILVLGIAASLLFLLVPEMSSSMGLHIMSSPTGIHLGDLAPAEMQIPRAAGFALLLSDLLAAVVGIWIISLLQKILKPMTEGRPFDHQIAPTIRKIGWLYMAAAVLKQVTDGAASALTFLQLQNAAVSGATLNLQINLNFLVTFGILMLLSYVFEYGQELQKLSDETV